jgi:hypothetical protein
VYKTYKEFKRENSHLEDIGVTGRTLKLILKRHGRRELDSSD